VNEPEQWGKIKEIVGAALERDPSERPAFLNVACGADQSLRAEVESLLSAHASADGLSESALTQTFADAGKVSNSLGPYSLVHKLGEGGMGQVWLAEQTSPVRRKVALKLIKAGMYDDSVLRRFQSERQSLAIMDHPAIAKVFDAGTTPEGQPYFVMEYVPGVAITEYCDQKKLRIRARLELFMRACEGVQHAHQKATIHRDLKPANILVVEVDGKPMPRIIDFGLAKPVTPFVSGETTNTKIGGLVGTPGYMSPEQTDPAVVDVDTRTDVYSLGVVLYELLTGFLPFDAERLKKLRLEEVLRHLREEDPPRPSTKVSADRKTSSSRAQARGTEPKQLSSLLRGDLDWIAMKTLEKERNRRYGTPSELAADIERYLHNQPVVARPASAAYRLRKYVRRNRVGVAVASGAVALLVTFVVMQALQLRRTTRERDRANRITEFMTSMFKVSDPGEARGNSITVREILDKSSREIETGLAKDPELQAQLMGTMGRVYVTLGLFPQAQTMLEKSLATSRLAGTITPTALLNMGRLSFLLMREGRYADAEKLLREANTGNQRVLGPGHVATLENLRYLATCLETEGKYEEADKVQRETLETARKSLGREHVETLLSMNVMANILDDERRFPAAEQLYRETWEIQRRTVGTEDPDTLTTASNLAGVVEEQGRLTEAEKLQRETLATRVRVLGAEHPDTLAVKLNLGNTLDAGGRHAEAEELYRQTLDAQRRVLGPENPDALMTQSNLGNALRKEGKYSEAEKMQRETLDVKRRVLGPEHPETVKCMGELAATLASDGKFDEARKLYGTRVQVLSRDPLQNDVAGGWYDFGCGAALAGRREEALDLLRQAIEHGYADAEHMKIDDDLKSLNGDPRFDALVADARKRAVAAKVH
jgi:eukaryotic-like serine/threonine-protein kinase